MHRWGVRTAVGLCLVAGVAVAAVAADLAVIVETGSYADLPDLPGGALDGLEPAFAAAGYEVRRVQDATGAELQDALAGLRGEFSAADRVVAVLSGHLVTGPGGGWLLGRDAAAADGFAVARAGLPLAGVLELLAAHPGAAILALVAPDTPGPDGAPGYRPAAVPQGVTVLAGPAPALVAVLTDRILAGMAPGAALDGAGSVTGLGFLPRGPGFAAPPPPPPPPAAEAAQARAEAIAWEIAAAADAEAGYETYLTAFPDGLWRSEAVDRRAALRLGDAETAEAVERSLGLTHEDRRGIQRDLTALGHDTGGVDGIFGPGTRAAALAWQRDAGRPATGYFGPDDLARLEADLQARAAALAEEERRAEDAAARADSAFWRETGLGETAEGLRRYLERHPNGLFAGVARGRLARLDAGGGDVAPAPAPGLDDPVTRVLVEERLRAAGFDPGGADGVLDAETAAAVRAFQEANGLPVTGVVTAGTLRVLRGE